jgi:hypothetical protein
MWETKTQKQTNKRKWNIFEIVVWKTAKMRMRGYRTLIGIFLPTHFHHLSKNWRTILWNLWCQSLISVFRIEIISETRQKHTHKHQHKQQQYSNWWDSQIESVHQHQQDPLLCEVHFVQWFPKLTINNNNIIIVITTHTTYQISIKYQHSK